MPTTSQSTPLSRTRRRLPFCGLHLVTWCATVALAATLVHIQLDLRRGVAWSALEVPHTQGWPLIWRHVTSNVVTGGISTVNWFPSALLANTVASLVLVLSVAFVCERWLRGSRRWRFSMRTLALLATIIALLLAYFRYEFDFYVWLAEISEDGRYVLHGGIRRSPWFIAAPLTIGLSCVIAAVFCLLGGAMQFLGSRPKSP